MALPAGRYGVTKNQLLKIKKLPMNTIKLIEELTEKFDLLGTAAFKNSTSVVTESSDLVESGAVKDLVGWGNKNLCNYNGVNNVVIAQVKNGVTYTFSVTSTGHGGFSLKKNDSSGTSIAQITPMSAGRNSVSFTADSDFDLFLNGYGFGGYTFAEDISDLQLEVGSTATAYEPYHASVEETLRDAEVIDCKNLIPITLDNLKTWNTAGSWSGNVYSLHGVNFTVNTNDDGHVLSIKANGTNSASSQKSFMFGDFILPAGNYLENGLVNNGSYSTFWINLYNVTDGVNIRDVLNANTDVDFALPSTKNVRMLFYFAGNVTLSNVYIYPMIRLASETDPTYEPYYVPLKDVVPNKCDNSVIAPVENGTTASQAYAVGEHFIRDGKFCTVTVAVTTSSTWTLGSNYVEGDVAELLAVQSGTPTPKTGVTIGERNTIHKVGSIVIMNIYVLTDLNGTSKSLFTLPSGFTPSNIKNVLAFDGNGAPLGRIYITDGGEVGIATSQTQSNIYINATVSYVI